MCPFGKRARDFFEMFPDYKKRTFLFDIKCTPTEIGEEPNNSHILNDKQELLNHCRARNDWNHNMIDFSLMDYIG